jgi:quercetin dioxygenase-like cupin family protein
MIEVPAELGPVGDHILFENDLIRAWLVDLPPGGKQPWHQHLLDYLIVPLTEGRNVMRFADGRVKNTDETPGTVLWREAGIPHELENLADWRYKNVLIEFKRTATNG